MTDNAMTGEDLNKVETLKAERRDVGPEVQQELDQLKISMQHSRMQANRMRGGYEPVSLPPSQAPSRVWSHSAVIKPEDSTY